MKNINHLCISLIDGLAGITQHHDRQMLEDSVLETINDLFPIETLQLFRLQRLNESKLPRLVSFFDKNGLVVINDESPLDEIVLNSISAKLESSFKLAIETNTTELFLDDEEACWKVIYPISNSENKVFSLLVCHCSDRPSLNEQQLMKGILAVYSNYLTLIEKTQRDKLTGLFNRETLDTEITKVLLKGTLASSQPEKENEKRSSEKLSIWLGLIDIDHFKSINDTYGHLYGDEVLILVARLMMSSCVREDDLVYRYGGEEFVVMLKAANEHHAMMAFDRLRQNVNKHEFPQVGNVAISIGFVEVMGQQSHSDVIGMADDALYYAKENGRNQTISYKELLAQGKVVVSKHVDNSDVDMFIDEVIF